MSEGRKDDGGKLRWNLLPTTPMQKLVEVYGIGARKYGENNWRKGLAWGRIFAAMMRHAWAWWSGEQHDPVDGQHHLASVAWAALTLMEYEVTHTELDDRIVTVAKPQEGKQNAEQRNLGKFTGLGADIDIGLFSYAGSAEDQAGERQNVATGSWQK